MVAIIDEGRQGRSEWPVEHRLPGGTVVRGKIDVVVEAESTLAIVDHKVIVADDARALEEAARYAGQLTTYANALVAAKALGEVEMVIHLPLSGLVVYVGEDVEPAVQVGQTVTSSTLLGRMYAGPDGIETGWADPTALGNTMARTYQQFDGSNSTAFGSNFSQFLQSVGAPGGIPQNNPPSGQLPPSWPRW